LKLSFGFNARSVGDGNGAVWARADVETFPIAKKLLTVRSVGKRFGAASSALIADAAAGVDLFRPASMFESCC
jgi:hypothetical protein